MSTTNLFAQNAATASQDLTAATSNGVNMPYTSQTVADMNRTINPAANISQIPEQPANAAPFGTHIHEAVEIIKDWTSKGR